MRYRQVNQQYRSSEQQAKELIKNDDVLSTTEQEEVIAYFARSLRTSTQFLKVVVCLHTLVALVYMVLLLSGSLMFDLEMDEITTMKLMEMAQQQRHASTSAPSEVRAAAAAIIITTSAPVTQDPLAVMAKLDVEMRGANLQFARDYLKRSGTTLSSKSVTVTNVVSAVMMLYSAGLLLWAAWSGYVACRLLRVNIVELTSTEPRELGALASSNNDASSPASASCRRDTLKKNSERVSISGRLQRLSQRMRADPSVAQYVIAALASVASCFWFCALLRRQLAMQRAYVAVGLPPPSVFAAHKVTDALLEYVLAVWQPLFHLVIGGLLRSMLDTKENLVTLSKMKYRFDKV